MNRKIIKIMSFIIIFICLFTSTFINTNFKIIKALTTSYSDVLEDLQENDAFNIEDYPENETDYTISVIQIAENIDDELYVYTYQPYISDDMQATSINISKTSGEDINYSNYRLILINANGVFCKYKVKDFEVQEDKTKNRIYEISSIFRKWFDLYDEGLEKVNDNTITEVSFRVAKRIIASTEKENVRYEISNFETITITDKFVGFVRYPTGYYLNVDVSCDGHFVAFSTDKQIDKLISAKVTYSSQLYTYRYVPAGNSTHNFEEINYDNEVNLTYKDKSIVEGGGIFSSSYEWDRIQTVDEFLKQEENNFSSVFNCAVFNVGNSSTLSESGTANIKTKQWVLRFKETDYSKRYLSSTNVTYYTSTLIGDVSILQLTFETNGDVYTMAAIDNKQTGSQEPINNTSLKINLNYDWNWLLKIISIILIIILIFIFLPLILSILTALIELFGWIVKRIISLIFWIIDIFKKDKKRRG